MKNIKKSKEKNDPTKLKEFEICFRVYGHLIGNVKAVDLDEAKQKAEILFSESDFGELTNIDSDLLYVDDDNGVRFYEK